MTVIERDRDAIEAILRSWLDDTDLTIFCGRWHDGGVMELLPGGRVELSGPCYDEPFAGIRELRLADAAHHVHLDLGRLTRACYLVLPSVCYGFRPSFELRLTGAGEDPKQGFGIGLGVRSPYAAGRLRAEPVQRFFNRLIDHLHRYPDVVTIECNAATPQESPALDWKTIDDVLQHWANDGRRHVAATLGRIRDALAVARSTTAVA